MEPGRRQWWSAVRGWDRTQASRGSILLVSYLLVAILLGLAVPQTMRSMSSIQLEPRAADDLQLRQLAEASITDAIRVLRMKENADLGYFYDKGPASDPASTSQFPCSPWDYYWRCYHPGGDKSVVKVEVPSQPNSLGSYTLKVADVWNSYDPNFQGFGKAIISGNFITRRQVHVETTLNKTKDSMACDLVMDIKRVPTSNNINGGVLGYEKVVIGSGATLSGDVTVYGSNSPRNKDKFVWLKKNANVDGKVLVGFAGQSIPHTSGPTGRLCCDTDDAIRLGYGATITSGKTTLATTTGIDSSQPKALQPGWREDPDGNLLGALSPTPDPAPYVCGGGAALVLTGDTHTYLKNDPSVLGVIKGFVTYCFDSLQIRSNAKVQFEGDKVKVIVKGTTVLLDDSIKVGTNTTVFSFPTGGTPGDPSQPGGHTQLEFHVTAGTTKPVRVMGKASLYGSIAAPGVPVYLGARSDTDTTVEADPALDGSSDDLDPNSSVDVPGFIQGKEVWLRSNGTLNMRVRQGSNKGGPTDNGDKGNGVTIYGARCARLKK